MRMQSCQKRGYSISAFLFMLFLFFIDLRSSEAGSLWLIASEPQTPPQSGDVFQTELQFASWNLTLGSYRIAVLYDPEVIRILNVTIPVQSEFYDNTFAEKSSFDTGTTHIAGFQIGSQNQQDSPRTFAVIQWEAVGSNGDSSEIQFDPEILIDPMWRPFEETYLVGATIDIAENDTDRDGLPDELESRPGSCTDPFDADSDDDGISDGDEDANHDGVLDATETNPCNPDSDGDGLQDGTEMGLTSNDIGPDTDIGVFQADLDPTTVTDPLSADSDQDGLMDGEEDVNKNGLKEPGELDPLDDDCDDDGYLDGIERDIGTNPLDQGSWPWIVCIGVCDEQCDDCAADIKESLALISETADVNYLKIRNDDILEEDLTIVQDLLVGIESGRIVLQP